MANAPPRRPEITRSHYFPPGLYRLRALRQAAFSLANTRRSHSPSPALDVNFELRPSADDLDDQRGETYNIPKHSECIMFVCVIQKAKKGSEQESVRPLGLIGFPGFRADGLTRLHGPGSEGWPMFTGLRPAPALRAAANGNRLFPAPQTTAAVRHINEVQARAGGSARQLNRVARRPSERVPGRPKRPEDAVK